MEVVYGAVTFVSKSVLSTYMHASGYSLACSVTLNEAKE
eukprot:CAMPEP_0184479842 /NCGR_PEP_ID=MMETSP0113_2-20130426/1407_1 /TAXON_ID=91329 /ORGANISM="Norrisiella sphaerica, Strain BC52" /LENGTH=38 /DNA_ID= /DNA_START= /DNA_END= /DNA_ORIENTATION=